jgi:hypothetical protein
MKILRALRASVANVSVFSRVSAAQFLRVLRGAYESRCTVAGENAGRHTATYSAPSGSGVE